MRSAGRFVIGIIGNALALILAIVLLPYGFQAANKLFPSMSGEIQIQSTVLKQSLENSARLETATVDEEGVLIAETNVIILGTVGKSVITYRNQGSFGIDLRKVNIELSGNDMTFILPPVEVMMDKIEPIDINQNNFFSYRIDKSTEELLEEQRIKCRAQYLEAEENREMLNLKTRAAFEETILGWLNDYGKEHYTFHFRMDGNEEHV